MKYQCWWFGINNANKPKPNSHVVYSQIESLLDGSREEFEWPYHKQSKRFYERMQSGDKVLLWMGDRGSYSNWGILGFGFIDDIRGANLDTRQYILKVDYVPSIPLMPYPSGQPQETEETRFLKEIFGLNFRPLGKTFNNLGHGTKRHIITIDEVQPEQYNAVLERVKRFPNVIMSSADGVETEFAPKSETEAQLFDDISSILELPHLDETVKKRLQASRIGQGRFRHSLMGYWGSRCSVTGFEDERVLRASHIKPWRDCDNFERLDPFNGLLLIPNLDVVFDQGLITFDEQGCVDISPSFQEKAKFLGITNEMKLRHIDKRHKQYIAYHRERVFITKPV